MRTITEIDVIKRSIQRHREDLHLMFTNNVLGVETEYYNEINLALLEAEEAFIRADKRHAERLARLKTQ